jgi:hypothetical protein
MTKEKYTNSKNNSFYIKKELVENIPRGYFCVWSSTEYRYYTSDAWFVYFEDGIDGSNVKSFGYYVLCVADSNL